MRNFARALALALKNRGTFVASVCCALMVGVLWGGSISTILPFVEVAFGQRSLQTAVEQKASQAEANAADLGQQLQQLRESLSQVAADQQRQINHQIQLLSARRQAEQRAAAFYRWLAPIVDRYLPRDRFATLVLVVLVLVLGTALKSLFLVAHSILAARFAQLGSFELRKIFFRHALQMDVAGFRRDGATDLMSRFTHDMAAIAAGLEYLAGRLIREPLKMIACLAGAALICWRLLLVSLLVAPVALLVIRWLGRMLRRANLRAMEQMAELYGTLEEAFRGIPIVKAFTMEPYERKRFHATSRQYYRHAMRIARYDALVHPATELLGIGTICIGLLAGAWLVFGQHTHLLGIRMSARPLDLASLALFYGFLAATADPIRKLSDAFGRLQRAAAAADRVYAMIDRQPQVQEAPNARRLHRHSREIVFENVSFAYVPGKPVLEDVSLTIRYGETVAIVGPSGCGKSTLANLLWRFADPSTGRIVLDGHPLGEFRLRDLRRQIGLVTQDPILFNDTVYNNIRYGSLGVSRAEVVEAARQAFAHDFVERELPDGYDTIVGPMGSRLSGGQRQRIALARAIVRDPAILILDEATSQIDLESERMIYRALERFVPGRTTIIITHRLGALALADRIVVMQEGKILDIGSHETLLARCELYCRLHQSAPPLKASA